MGKVGSVGQILISVRNRKDNAVVPVLDLPFFFLKCVLLHLFIYLLCVCWGGAHAMASVKVRGELVGAGSCFLPCDLVAGMHLYLKDSPESFSAPTSHHWVGRVF